MTGVDEDEALVEEDSEAVDDGFAEEDVEDSLEVDEVDSLLEVEDGEVTREDVLDVALSEEVGTTGFGAELLAEVEDEADDDEEELEDGVSLSHLTLMPAVALEGTSLPG